MAVGLVRKMAMAIGWRFKIPGEDVESGRRGVVVAADVFVKQLGFLWRWRSDYKYSGSKGGDDSLSLHRAGGCC